MLVSGMPGVRPRQTEPRTQLLTSSLSPHPQTSSWQTFPNGPDGILCFVGHLQSLLHFLLCFHNKHFKNITHSPPSDQSSGFDRQVVVANPCLSYMHDVSAHACDSAQWWSLDPSPGASSGNGFLGAPAQLSKHGEDNMFLKALHRHEQLLKRVELLAFCNEKCMLEFHSF